MQIKGIVQLKMKIQSFSSQPCADGRSGEIFFRPQNAAEVSQEKGVEVISQKIAANEKMK